MKRLVLFFVTFLFVLTVFLGTASAAESFDYNSKVSVAMLVDADSGEVLFATDNIDEKIHPASTTKIMTCILAIESADLDADVTISPDAVNPGGSKIELVANETINMKDLLTGMMVESGNDAALAVAIHMAGSVSAFVDKMNEKAAVLGMTNTHFANPHGKDDDEHLTTARDMSLLAQYAFKNPTFMDIVDTETFDMKKQKAKLLKNTNLLIRQDEDAYYRYATGMKTGSTKAAGRCLVASATKDDMNLICLMFGDPDENGPNRWPLAKKLFDYGFDSYTTTDVASLLKDTEPVQVQVESYAANDESSGLIQFDTDKLSDVYKTLDKDVMSKILDGTYTIAVTKSLSDDITAPIAEGDLLGAVTYTCAETQDILYSGDLIAPRDVIASGMEPDASGNTAVETMPPVAPGKLVRDKDNALAWIWLIIPIGLIVFLVIRLITVNKRKRRRFKKRRPHYSYRIK